MLELKNITKTYKVADDKVQALKGISLKFREAEFVSILGQSGCGKTTLLNIIGGLDRYTTGDLIINGKSTKSFKDRDWDAYRNYKVGFVFQSYNLISHQTVLSNVELALTIGGISRKERKERAIKALEEVGLKDHIHKKPNQLSGGQMQRVAIARALVNNPDIILADEPTGALDTKTSVQVMEILKKISKDKLIIMVTHNPELAEEYSSRIIKILDGKITEDSNPINNNVNQEKVNQEKIGRTSMKFWTAFRLSLNNLLTKKGRTILVSFAGSIGIIGIALVQSVSNGFQGYVDHIEEDTLTSYPFTITQETTDIAGTILSLTMQDKEVDEDGTIKEQQYISDMLSNVSTNDLRSFKKYLENNYGKVKNDISTVKYSYSVDPLIYTEDVTGKIAKLNPSNLFNNSYSMGFSSSFSSIYSQMVDDIDGLNNSYDILSGRWPQKYDEMILVLSDRNSISDLLVYSLGLRDTKELSDIVTKIMNGETAQIDNEPLNFSYDDLMNVKLKLVMPADTYKYNKKYDIYEDMTEDEEYMKDIYRNAMELKIVGIVTAKDGVTSAALTPGVSYTSDLVQHIIDYSANTDIVKKQLENDEIDVFSGSRFDSKNNNLDLNFQDLVSIDNKKLQSAFNIKINPKDVQSKTEKYMKDISNSVTTDISPAKKAFTDGLTKLAKGLLNKVDTNVKEKEIDSIVSKYMNEPEANNILTNLEKNYVLPKETFKTTYSALLKAMLQVYISSYNTASSLPSTENISLNELNVQNYENVLSYINENYSNAGEVNKEEIISKIIPTFTSGSAINQTANTMAKIMTETVMKKTILTKVGELTSSLSSSYANAFKVDESKIASAFKLKITEDEITRIITATMRNKEKTAKTNLTSLGYQDKEEPTYIGFYFNSFEGKENFLKFIDSYNESVEEDKKINYTDTTGILMNSVKTIVNAVTYVLIVFISISLVVSSIMIGIITYISVYERTKEIGILRAIGASKHNISSIFNAETFIIGLLSGLLGIGFTYAVIPLINKIIHSFTGNIPLNATFYFKNAIVLVILSVILTLIGGLIPAKAASKKDPVIALRTE